MKPYKTNSFGWDLGIRFKVVSRKKWGTDYVYKLQYQYESEIWVEYHSHKRLKKEQCFHYNYEGKYMGKYFELEAK